MGRAMPGHPDQRLGRRASRTVLVALLAILLLPVANASANAFTTVERVLQTDIFAFDAAELFGCEERLR